MDDVERELFRSDLVAVGAYRCPPDHERFRGGHVDEPLVVFPRTAVIIDRERRRSVFADPNTAVFYNPDEDYRRRGVDRRGDLCDWFALAPRALEALVGASGASTGQEPFPWTHGPAPPDLYLRQRSIVDALESADPPEPMETEEAVVGLFADSTRSAGPSGGEDRSGRRGTRETHTRIVDDLRQILGARHADHLTLDALADEVAVSVFHLCRIFRRHTGMTINQYVTQLRLRRALDSVVDPATDLATLAFDLGFSSHSHFTRRFRTAFGMPPSALRRAPRDRLAELRKIVQV